MKSTALLIRQSLDSAWGWRIVLCAWLALHLMGLGRLSSDAVIALQAANRWLAGALFHQEILEPVSPALIMLAALPAFLAKLTGLDAGSLYGALTLLLCLAALRLFHLHLAATPWVPPHLRRLMTLALVFLLLLFEPKAFGSAGQLLAILVLPYLAAAYLTMQDISANRGARLSVALSLAFGLALNPLLIIPVLLIELVICLKRHSAYPLLRPELSLAILTAVLLVVKTSGETSLELASQLLLQLSVQEALAAGLSELVLRPVLLCAVTAMTLIFVLLSQAARLDSLNQLGLLSVIAALGLSDAYLIAGDPNGSTAVTVAILMNLALAIVLATTFLSPRPDHKRKSQGVPFSPALRIQGAAVVVAALAAFFSSSASALFLDSHNEEHRTWRLALESLIQKSDGNSRLFAFTADPDLMLPMAAAQLADSPYPYSHLWPLRLYESDHRGAFRWNIRAGPRPREAQFRSSLVAALLKHPPDFVALDLRPWRKNTPQPFDYLGYFSQDPRFLLFWQNYAPVFESDLVSLYQLVPELGAAEP